MTSPDVSRELDARGLARILRRRLWVVVLCIAVTGGAAFAFSQLQEKRYTATASLLFRDPGFDQRLFGGSVFEGGLDEGRAAATNVQLASLDIVADETAKDLSLDPDDVDSQVEVEEEGQSDVVSIAATNPDPGLAARMANSFASNYVDFRREADRAKVDQAIQLVESEIDQLNPEEQAGPEGDDLRSQVGDLTTLKALQTGNAELVQPASDPEDPSSPQVARNAALGVALGLMLGVLLAFLLERLDRRVRETDELERIFGLPVLTSVPESEALDERPEGSARQLPFDEAEAFRTLRTRLRFFNVDRNVQSVVVTSAAPGEGKSTVSWNLALASAAAGVSTLLIEADLHRPVVAAAADLSPLPGLSEVITHQSRFENSIQHFEISTTGLGANPVRSLAVVVAGATPPNAAELLESEQMARLLETAKESYDFIVIDTPPVGVLADAVPLMRLASGVIVVSRVGTTTRDEAQNTASQLDKLDMTTLGIVANRSPRSNFKYGYGAYSSNGSTSP